MMGNNTPQKSIRDEIIGITLLACALFSTVSLLSYYLTDRGRPTMWGGVVGEHISEVLFLTIGLTSYIIPLLILAISLWFLSKREISYRLSRVVSLFIFIISLSGLFSLLIGNNFVAGGIVGQHISYYLSFYLGASGTFIFLTTLIIIAVVIATGFSLYAITGAFIYLARWPVAQILAIMGKKGRTSAWTRKKKRTSSPTIVSPPKQKMEMKTAEELQEHFEFLRPTGKFQAPPLSFLDVPPDKSDIFDRESIIKSSMILEKKLKDFDVDGKVVEVRPGPVVTMYEFEPAPGVKVGKIVNLSDDLALAMRAFSVRILAPIPGKAVVGIEIPNPIRERIFLREILENTAYAKCNSMLPLGIGKDISGAPFVADLAKMPHLLVAGATGAGKSVFVNILILSIIYRAAPDDVRFLMIDPKMLELSPYEGIPHLLTPVVTDPKRAAATLKGIVIEMEERYRRMSEMGAKNIRGYNQLFRDDAGEERPGWEERRHGRLPYIVVVIDELSDLMIAAGKDVEESLIRLSQMARAAGIHLIVATQRPSVDVITGLIKSNFPARISFQVPSRTDSRTILDHVGAESLLGEGDMLFLPPGSSRIRRIHGAYVSETEIKRVARFLKKQGRPSYNKEIAETRIQERSSHEDEYDEGFMKRFNEAVKLASDLEMISTSYIQRRFRIGYNTAARIIEKMEAEGIVGPAQGSKPREVLIGRGNR